MAMQGDILQHRRRDSMASLGCCHQSARLDVINRNREMQHGAAITALIGA